MSISTQITRLQNLKNSLRTKLVSMIGIPSTANLEDCVSAVESIVDNGAVSVSVKEGESYTIPAGYHNGSGTVAGASGGGNYTLQTKTGVVPTKSRQQITSDAGYYGLSSVSIEAIPNNYQDVSDTDAVASDVMSGKKFVLSDGTLTAGTMVNNGTISQTIDGTNVTSYVIPAGYHSGNGTVALDNTIETALAAI